MSVDETATTHPRQPVRWPVEHLRTDPERIAAVKWADDAIRDLEPEADDLSDQGIAASKVYDTLVQLRLAYATLADRYRRTLGITMAEASDWRLMADEIDTDEPDSEDEDREHHYADQLRDCAVMLEQSLNLTDSSSSEGRQFLVDEGRHPRHEFLAWAHIKGETR